MSGENAAGAGGGGILVVGGGITGMSVAVEAGEVGTEVFLVEKEPFLGGRVVRINQYFPKLCPPTCGFEINARRIKQNPGIHTFAATQVKNISGKAGNFTVTLESAAERVNDRCTACGKCVEVCPRERPNDFNLGMDTCKAIYLPHEMAFPFRFAIDAAHCDGASCAKCVKACGYDAIQLDAKPKTFDIQVSAIVLATGWRPYDAARITNLGFGKFKNVITNVMMERMSSPSGPTGGKIQRPSDGAEPKRVAFVQCAGSRDENHLGFCSGVCCAASLKQSTYIRERLPETEVEMFYIDVRAAARLEDFAAKIQQDEKLTMTKGKVAEITESGNGCLTVVAEDTLSGEKVRREVDLVVLATGMEPNPVARELVPDLPLDEHGFIHPDTRERGIIGAGCARAPMDVYSCVQDATAAALRAITVS